eukprot:TRINITY_DN39071_c0_g1_i1.p1 TRINITY_DN39071_c0_g1~~TRINITY_DN39071_c0_g1_i1.p1  ORF type:complete len:298 (-),score=54.37 TRINITY_DN39071_c0_g1_i1:581-1474(-)
MPAVGRAACRIPTRAALIVWVMVVVFCEHWLFQLCAARCGWPEVSGPGTTHRVVLVSDPQLTDFTSYKILSVNRGTRVGNALLAIYEHLCDGYMRRMWRAIRSQNPLNWDLTIFLGDMFDGGRYVDDTSAWDALVRRFDRIFDSPRRSTHPKSLFAAGNHDVNMCTNCTVKQMYRHGLPNRLKHMPLEQPSLGPMVQFGSKVLNRHIATFNRPNQVLQLADVRLVLVDSVSLTSLTNVHREATRSFFHSVPKQQELTTMLLTHVPLWRPPHEQGARAGCLHGLKEHIYFDFQNTLSQ